MALTIITPQPTATESSLAIGTPVERIVIFQTSKETLVGETIQMRLSLFSNLSDPDPSAANQTICYSVTYPDDFALIPMIPTVGLHPTKRIYNVWLSYINDRTFSIRVNFLMTMDMEGFWPSGDNDNVFRFEKNTISNPAIDDNTYPSVYNESRQFKMEATNWDGSTAESAIYKETFKARFWCSSNECCEAYSACILSPVTDWAYQLYRNDNVVSGFSAYENTNLKFQASFNGGNTPVMYFVGVYRKQNHINVNAYWQEISFSYARFNPTVSSLSPSPFNTSAFAPGGTAMTNIVDDIWEADIELRADYFEPLGLYRAFIVVLDSEGNYYSCNTFDIVADGCSQPNIADIESRVWQYRSTPTTYTADTLINVATRGRLKIDMRFDKQSYNANLVTNGLTGNYNINFKTSGIRVLDHFPEPNPILGLINDLPHTATFESSTIDVYSTTFQVPESWSATVKYIVFIWNFQINLGGNICKDQLRKVIKLQVRQNDEEVGNFTPVLTHEETELEIGDICLDDVDVVQLCFTEGFEDEFDFIQVWRLGGAGNYTENDEYEHDELTQLTSNIITAADDDTADDDGCMSVDISTFPLDEDLDIGGVFIGKSSPDPTSCSTIDFYGLVTYVSGNKFEQNFTFEFDLSPLIDDDILQVEVSYNIDGSGWITELFNTATTVLPIEMQASGDFLLGYVYFIINITLATGCQYHLEYNQLVRSSTPGHEWENDTTIDPI